MISRYWEYLLINVIFSIKFRYNKLLLIAKKYQITIGVGFIIIISIFFPHFYF